MNKIEDEHELQRMKKEVMQISIIRRVKIRNDNLREKNEKGSFQLAETNNRNIHHDAAAEEAGLYNASRAWHHVRTKWFMQFL